MTTIVFSSEQPPMKPSIALELHREAIRRLVERYNVRHPRIFGSVLHGVDAEGSDLDLLVDPLPHTTLLDLGGLQVDLEEMLGVPVDLLTPGDLPAKFRASVLYEALPV
jgi:predicted nucleotidyltransferase